MIGLPFGTEKLVATLRRKRFEDMFSRFDRMPACDDEQTDGHLVTT